MSRFKVSLAKILMNLFPSKPEFGFGVKLSEIINHQEFISKEGKEKDEILFNMAANHYKDNENKPFDIYFPNYSLQETFSNKRILDLGCWCGGKAVSYAEKWNIKEIYGTDINTNFIRAAQLFSESRNNSQIKYNFQVAYGENLPFEDNFFDAIVTFDVLEHVVSLEQTLNECKRVLVNNGKLFAVFPSYYTIGESHLNFATKMPIIQWLFSSKTLNQAYYEIIDKRGPEAYWYKTQLSDSKSWEEIHAGIGINGTTFKKFRLTATKAGFSEVKIIPTPFLSVGKISLKYPFIKKISLLFKPLVKIKILQDYLSHRIVAVLTK